MKIAMKKTYLKKIQKLKKVLKKMRKKCCQRGGTASRDDACFLVDLESDTIFHTLLCKYLILAFHHSRCLAEVEVRLQDLGQKTDKG